MHVGWPRTYPKGSRLRGNDREGDTRPNDETTRQIVGPNDEGPRHLVFHLRGNDEGETATGPSYPPRASLSNAPEPFSVRRGVLLRGALGAGGHPVSSLAAKCRNLAASLMVRAEALVYSWRE